jgi:hypothetical protein
VAVGGGGWKGGIGKYRLEIFFIGFWIGKSRREEWHVPLEPTAGAVLRDVAPGFSTFMSEASPGRVGGWGRKTVVVL